MTDYEGWTETEVDFREYETLSGQKHRRSAVTYTLTPDGKQQTTYRYFRLDPPAPKYREGEMRWLTLGDNRYLCQRTSVSAWDAGVTLFTDDCLAARTHTLSDPVVVVPAPTDEERRDFLWAFGNGEGATFPRGEWLIRVAAAMEAKP